MSEDRWLERVETEFRRAADAEDIYCETVLSESTLQVNVLGSTAEKERTDSEWLLITAMMLREQFNAVTRGTSQCLADTSEDGRVIQVWVESVTGPAFQGIVAASPTTVRKSGE